MAKVVSRNGAVAERTVEFQGGTITVIDRPKNYHRNQYRKVADRLVDAGVPQDDATLAEFASIVGYTVRVSGSFWQPPPMDTSGEALYEAYEYWLYEVDADVTDAYMQAIYARDTAPALAPVPPPATDPNA